MARFKTLMIETGAHIVDNSTGLKLITLESPFIGRPTVTATIGPDGTNSLTDPGDENVPSFNANAFISALSNSSGFWTFVINTEKLNETITIAHAGEKYKSIQVNWRAIGPVSGT